MVKRNTRRKSTRTRATPRSMPKVKTPVHVPREPPPPRHGVLLSAEERQRMLSFIQRWKAETKVPNPHEFPVMWLYRKVKLTPELEEFNWILSKSAPSDKYLAKFDPQTSPVSTGSAYVNVFGSALRKVLSDQRVAGNILKDIWRKLPWEYLNLCENYYRRKLNRGGHEPEPFPDSEDEDEDNHPSTSTSSSGDSGSMHRGQESGAGTQDDDSDLEVPDIEIDSRDTHEPSNLVCTQFTVSTSISFNAPDSPPASWDHNQILPLLGINDPFAAPFLDSEVPLTYPRDSIPITTYDGSIPLYNSPPSQAGHVPRFNDVPWTDSAFPHVSLSERELLDRPLWNDNLVVRPMVPPPDTPLAGPNDYIAQHYTFSPDGTLTSFQEVPFRLSPSSNPFSNRFNDRRQ